MKRGLKGQHGHELIFDRRFDAGITPMKRGLKVHSGSSASTMILIDAGITPMKRGLKEHKAEDKRYERERCRDYPDEKGTERGVASSVGLGHATMQGLPR